MTLKQEMTRHNDFRGVQLFTLIAFLYSWPIFFVVDAWLLPIFISQGSPAAVWLTALFGHMLAMAGPALGAIVTLRRHHKESLPSWKWSRPRYYVLAALAMLTLWTLSALIGLVVGDSLRLWPIETFGWVVIGSSLTVGWLAGLGEEVGWVAYLLPRLAPHIGRSRALVVAGAIRGLWHWPVLTGPVIAQVISGEQTALFLLVMGTVFAFQLVVSNAAFGAVFGWVWYRTESLPLMGWLHQWFNLARDVTMLIILGYAGTLWFKTLWMIPIALVAGLVLTQVAREEGANMWTLAPPRKAETGMEDAALTR